MKTIYQTILALLTVFAVPALAETPNRVIMSFEEFVNASGCEIRDNAAGQSNLYALDGGNCPASVVIAFNGTGSILKPGPDGILGTADDYTGSDN